MELTLSKNIDNMSPRQIKKFLTRMKEIKRWRENRKEKIIYRRYEIYLLFLVSLLSLCKYAIISLKFCKKKVTNRMTLIQLIVSVIVREYKPIYSRVQRRDNFFRQGRVKVDSFGRLMNLSLKPSTGHSAEVSKARIMLFGTQKQQKIMERQRKRLKRWEEKQNTQHKRDTYLMKQREDKKTCMLNNKKYMQKPGINVEHKWDSKKMKNNKIMHLKKKMEDGIDDKEEKKMGMTGEKFMRKKIDRTVERETGGKMVRKSLGKKLDQKRKTNSIGEVGNTLVRKVGRPPGKKRNSQLKTNIKIINGNVVSEQERKKRGRKRKTKDGGATQDDTVGIKVRKKQEQDILGNLLRKKKNNIRKMKMQEKRKHEKVIDAQAYVMKKSVVNLRRMLLISYADLLYRHPNLMEPHNLEIFNVLSDKDVSIRKTAVAVFTHLYMTDTVKAKTVLLVHMMFLTVDKDKKISSGAKSFFYELDRKAHNTLANNISDMVTVVIKNDRQWPFEKNKEIVEFLLYFMKKSKYCEALSEKIIRKMAEVELQNTEALNLYALVFVHIHIDEKVLQRILNCIVLIKHVIKENQFVYEKFIQICKRAGEKRRGRPVDESHQQSNIRTGAALYSEQGGKDLTEKTEGKMKELADKLYCEVESARQNISAWSINVPSSVIKKRHSKGKGTWDPSPGKKEGTPKKRDSTPQPKDNASKKRNSTPRKSNNFFNKLNHTPSNT